MLKLRILKVEYTPPDVFNLGYEDIFQKVVKVRILDTLMQSFDKFLFIVEIDWIKEPDNRFMQDFIFVEDLIEIMVNRSRTICLISCTLPKEYSEVLLQLSGNFNCFLEFPVIMVKEKITGNLVGTQKDINRFLEFLDGWGADYNTISVKNYYPKGYGVLSELSAQQLRCLDAAVEMGYFESPKRHTSREISQKLDITHSTFIEHIKKAERIILSNLFRL